MYENKFYVLDRRSKKGYFRNIMSHMDYIFEFRNENKLRTFISEVTKLYIYILLKPLGLDQ